MTGPSDIEPRAHALLGMDLRTSDERERALALLDVLAQQGTLTDLVVLARLLVMWSGSPLLRARASAALASIVRRQGAPALPRIDELLRGGIWAPYEDHERPWFNFRPDDLPAVVDSSDPHATCVLGLLSCHANGYVREAAVRALAARDDGLPWLLLRVNDWVSAVRSSATTAVIERLDVAGAPAWLEVLPLMWRLRELTRIDHRDLVARVVDLLARLPEERLNEALGHPDRWVRRSVMRLLAQGGRATLAQLGRALDDTDQVVRLQAAELVPGDASPEAEALRERLCNSRIGRLREQGLERMVEAGSPRAEHWLEQGVDDPVRSVRETARYLLRKAHGPIDFAARYRAGLAAGEHRAGLVQGLAEVGTPGDWERLVAVLDGPRNVAVAAIEACKTLDARETRELRLMMVDDPRPGVSAAAARSVRSEIRADDEDTLHEYLASPLAHVRRRAMELTIRLPGWRPGLLLLALENESVERIVLATTVQRWLAVVARRRAEPTLDEQTRLRELLAATTLLTPPERQHALDLLALSSR
jgi:hypothetical protein